MAAYFLFAVAMRNLRRQAARSALTTLGIVIGVAAVIAAVGIGSGAKAKVEKSLQKLNPNQISMMATMPSALKERMPVGGGLTLADYQAIKHEVGGIIAASPYSYPSPDVVRAKGKAAQGRLVALDSEGFEVTPRLLIAGSYFGPADVAQAVSVCVITQSMASFLFGSEDPVAQYLHLKNTTLRVIGVVADDKAFETAEQSAITDNEVFIPITSLLRRFDRNAQLIFRVKAASPLQIPVLRQRLGDLMESRRGKRKLDFRVEAVGDTLDAYTESSRTMAVLLTGIATISLVIGGIGIMNIMLVNVTERAHEIGILLAIGARSRDIRRQVLVESSILSASGGAIGVVLGVITAWSMAHFNDWPVRVTPGSIVAALLCSLSVGLFSGYYPARQASQLDPIEALRSE